MTNIAYKYRIYPSEEAQIYFTKVFGATRWLWNKMLSDKEEYYKANRTSLKLLVSNYKKDNPWLKEIDSLALANTLMNLYTAYNNFFSSLSGKRKGRRVGKPVFKSKKRCKCSFKTNVIQGCNNIKVDYKKGIIRIPKIKEDIKTIFHRPLPKDYVVKNLTISKTKTNKYFVSICMEVMDSPRIVPDLTNVVGVDFSMSNIFVTSDGAKAKHGHWFREKERLQKIRKRKYNKQISKIRNSFLEEGQKKLSKEALIAFREKLSNSKNLEKLRLSSAVISEKVSNQRKDTLYKEARKLTDKYDVLVFEDIDLQNMSKCLNFGKSVYDAGFGMFRTRVQNICDKSGKVFLKADKWFPSSKTCSVCGNIYSNLKLGENPWTCNCCNTTHDRDINAGINLKNYFINTVGTTGIQALGDCTST